MTWRPETTLPTNTQGDATKGLRLASVSLAVGILGLVWFFIAPAVGFVLRIPFGLNMYDIRPLITVSAIVCGFVGGHILKIAGLPTRKAMAGIVLGFVGLPFSLIAAGYFLFIRFVIFPAA